MQLFSSWLPPVDPIQLPGLSGQKMLHCSIVLVILALHSFQQLRKPSGNTAVALGGLDPQPASNIFG